MIRIDPAALLPLLLAAGVLAAGCGAGASPGVATAPPATRSAGSSGGQTATAAPQIDPCLLVNAGLAAEFIGGPVFDARLSDRGDGAACLYAAADGGAGTVGVNVSAATVGSNALVELAREVPDATAVPGTDHVLVATGTAWFVIRHHLVSVVLVEAGGRPGTPGRMQEMVRAILSGA